jgi:hypothetical protein
MADQSNVHVSTITFFLIALHDMLSLSLSCSHSLAFGLWSESGIPPPPLSKEETCLVNMQVLVSRTDRHCFDRGSSMHKQGRGVIAKSQG